MTKKLFYGFGNLSYSVIGQTISNFFMFFATSVLGINGTLVGIAIAISTIWDGISDVFIGYLSDNKPIGKFGKRNGYMFIATIGMSFFNILLWCVPNHIDVIVKFVWILVSLILLETFNTLFATPYVALGNELAESQHDRTKINAYSTIFYLIGIMIPSILLLVFFPNTDEYPIGQLNPAGYVKIAIVTSLICLVFGILSSLFTIQKVGKQTEEKSEKKSISLFGNFIEVFKNKKLRTLVLGFVMTSIATVFLCSVGLHFFTYSFFYSSWQITFLLLSLMIGNIISQPLWVKISQKRKKKHALVAGILLTIIAVFGVICLYIFRIALYNSSYYLMLIAIFLCGLGSGALYSLPNSIYGDEVMSSIETSNQIATYSSTMTLAGNIANSITQLLVGILLDVIHFDGTKQVQTLSVQTGLALILFIGVQFSLIIGCAIFSSYRSKGEKN